MAGPGSGGLASLGLRRVGGGVRPVTGRRFELRSGGTLAFVGAFVGGGAGISLIENGFVDEDAFHYQVGGGLTLAMSHRISIDLGYRFFQTEELDIADRLTTHTGQLAVRFGF